MSDTASGTAPTDTGTEAVAPEGTATDAGTTETGAEAVETTETETDPRVTRANQQAANYRTQLRAQETANAEQAEKLTALEGTLAKLAAVFNPEAGETQADPAEQLATITTEAQSLRSENSDLRAQLLVHELAGDNGGNANALLDSRSFLNTLQGLDAAAEDYRTKVAEAIKGAVDANTSLRATQVASAGGAETAGQGAGSGAAVTADQFKSMSYTEKTNLARTNPALYRQLAG